MPDRMTRPAHTAPTIKVALTNEEIDWCERREDESSHAFRWLFFSPRGAREEDDYEDLPFAKVYGRLNLSPRDKAFGSDELEERLALIVRAVNCHDELVEVARLAQAVAALEIGRAVAPEFGPQELYDAATAILARAKERP